MSNFLFFGDSITFGENDWVFGGWVDSLKRSFYHKFNIENTKKATIFNLGIGGETTNGLIKRIEVELNSRKSEIENYVFLAYGMNDLVIKKNKIEIDKITFKNNLNTAIQIIKKTTKDIYLISITPISTKIDNKIIEATGKLRSNKIILEYNELLKEISNKQSINFIDIHSGFTKNKEEYLSKDFLHPNEKGYEFIANNIQQIILEIL